VVPFEPRTLRRRCAERPSAKSGRAHERVGCCLSDLHADAKRGHGPALATLQDDHYYLVLEGKMKIEIGTDMFVVEKHQAAVIPLDVPLEVWNDGPEPEAHLEVIAPGSSRDLKAMFKPAQACKVENAVTYIRTPGIPTQAEMKPGLNGVIFAERKTGGNEQMRIDSTLPGQGSPKPNVHKFEQVSFEIEGSTDLTYGLNPLKIGAAFGF
jgi:mannose-6-phosphate isomerase-like protein (cupin superfamily)